MSDTRRLYHRIVVAAHRLRVEADRRCLDSAGVTAAQAGALFAIDAQPGCTQRQLAQALGLAESAVNGLVGRLEQNRLVERHRHPTDGRSVALTLSAEGRAAMRRVQRELDQFNQLIETGMSDRQLDGAAKVLDNILTRTTKAP